MDKVLLLADPNSKAWDFSEKIQAYIKENHKLSIPLQRVEMGHFNNGEIKMNVPQNVRNCDAYFVQDSTKNPQEWWVELLLLKDLLLNSEIGTISYVLPDIPYSRQDRKDRPRVPISIRALIASLAPGLKRIVTMDMHSPQSEGNYPSNLPLTNLFSFPEATRHLKRRFPSSELEKFVVASPDAGGVSRAKAFAKKIGSIYPIAFTYKTRFEAGKIDEMWFVGDVKDKDVLVVDDMYDTCGTQNRCGEVLNENGAKRKFAYATHAWFTNPEKLEELKRIYKLVMTSNTHYREGNDIDVVDVSPVFAEAIYRIQKGISISELFD